MKFRFSFSCSDCMLACEVNADTADSQNIDLI